MTALDSPELVPSADRGPIPFPSWCPSWCDRADHLEYARSSDGIYTAQEVTTHHLSGGNGFLPEIHNWVSHAVERPGGGSWDLDVRQALREPYDTGAGYASPPLIELMIADRQSDTRAQIAMTTGEVRVLAAHLLALADEADLSRPR